MELHLTDEDRKELKRYQRNVAERSSYVKVTTILMIDKGLDFVEIADYLGIDSTTIYRYLQSYKQDGLRKYLSTNYKGYWGQLSSYQLSELRKELNTNLYTDSKDICLWIKTRWGIAYTPQGIVDLLNRIGFTYKQTKQVPCESDCIKQIDFIETFANTLAQTADNKAVIYFVDGVHPTHNTRSTHAWTVRRCDRKRN